MSYLNAYGLAFFELSFVIVSLMFLHSLKQAIGNISFYISLGAVMVFAQFVTAAGLNISDAYPGLDVKIGPTIFFTPLMAALLTVYIVDGTLEAQRMILGIMGMVGIFLYFSILSEKQFNFPGYALDSHVPKSFIGPIFHSGRNFMLASLLSILVVFLALPIIYQLLRNRNIGLSVSVFGSLIFAEVFDSFFYELVTNFNADDWWEALRESYLTRALAMIWVSILTVTYLKLRDDPGKSQSDTRSTFDIVMAFLGRYGQARRLQANVREWEGRYRMVVENTNDLILLVSESGAILDANTRVIDTLGYTIEELSTMNIQSIIKSKDSNKWNWSTIWEALFPSDDTEEFGASRNVVGGEWFMETKKGLDHAFDTTITTIKIQKSQAALLVARDITRRIELEKEREVLQSQLIHSQRMEAVGQLAGGIAHDFNNLLHAIQGSLDMLDTVVAGSDQKARDLCANITMAVNRASKLTGQLLGFARGGKYTVVRINVEDLIRQTEGLFRPLLGKKVELKVVVHPDPMTVEGDFTQLEQVLLNILINAMAALDGKDGTIIFRAEPATQYMPGWNEVNFMPAAEWESADTAIIPRQDINVNNDNSNRSLITRNGASPDKYIVCRIRDSGCGMDETTKERIFEPFFTTKKQKGTGMGLAMAYGCVENHNGWIHVVSQIGQGSEFFVYLPRVS